MPNLVIYAFKSRELSLANSRRKSQRLEAEEFDAALQT